MMQPINCDSFRELLEEGVAPAELIEHLDHLAYDYTQLVLADEHRGLPLKHEALSLYYLQQIKEAIKAAIIK